MGKRISRKVFVEKSLAGLAGMSLIPRYTGGNDHMNANLRNLGNTGIKVSPLCFGAPRTNDESLIRYAIGKGLNFIDTGQAYSNGNNEKLVGRAITGIRKNIVIQSKIKLEAEELPAKGKGKKGYAEIWDVLSTKLDASLKALNTDYIDIMLIHDARKEDMVFHPEVMRFFNEAKRSGVIKAHGFSCHNDFMNIPSRNNSENFYNIIMTPFNHKGSYIHSQTGSFSEWDQNKLLGILTEAGSKGIAVISMKTCSGGKYSPTPGVEPSFREAVKWVLDHDFVSSAAVAMSNFEQVDEHTSWLAV